MSENYSEVHEMMEKGTPPFIFNNEMSQPTPIKAFPWGSPTIGQIAGALAKAQGVMQNPSKTKNVQQKRWSKAANGYVDASYKYAPLNEIQDVARAALSEHGIAVFQPVTGDASKIEVTTVVMHSSGEWLATDPLEFTPRGGDSGPSIQDLGSLITYLRRYSLTAALNISAAEDDTDGKTEGDEEQPQEGRKNTRQPAQQPSTAGGKKDYTNLPGGNQGKPAQADKPKQDPPKQPEKPAQTAPNQPPADLDAIKDEFGKALAHWLGKGGFKKADLDAVGKKLCASCAISSEDTDQWIGDDYELFMTRMDFETACKDWAAKGMTMDGVQDAVNAMYEAKEINHNVIDRLDIASYQHVMDLLDVDLGITHE